MKRLLECISPSKRQPEMNSRSSGGPNPSEQGHQARHWQTPVQKASTSTLHSVQQQQQSPSYVQRPFMASGRVKTEEQRQQQHEEGRSTTIQTVNFEDIPRRGPKLVGLLGSPRNVKACLDLYYPKQIVWPSPNDQQHPLGMMTIEAPAGGSAMRFELLRFIVPLFAVGDSSKFFEDLLYHLADRGASIVMIIPGHNYHPPLAWMDLYLLSRALLYQSQAQKIAVVHLRATNLKECAARIDPTARKTNGRQLCFEGNDMLHYESWAPMLQVITQLANNSIEEKKGSISKPPSDKWYLSTDHTMAPFYHVDIVSTDGGDLFVTDMEYPDVEVEWVISNKGEKGDKGEFDHALLLQQKLTVPVKIGQELCTDLLDASNMNAKQRKSLGEEMERMASNCTDSEELLTTFHDEQSLAAYPVLCRILQGGTLEIPKETIQRILAIIREGTTYHIVRVFAVASGSDFKAAEKQMEDGQLSIFLPANRSQGKK